MQELQTELKTESERKKDRANFEDICKQINKNPPAAESQAAITQTHHEIEQLERDCASTKII
jgi:hypothetical protein